MEDVIKDICAEYSIPIEAKDRLTKIAKELVFEIKMLRANYEFYRDIANNLMRMAERIRNLKFKDDTSGDIQRCLNDICDSLLKIKDSEAQKYVDEYLSQPDKRRYFNDEIL